MTDYVTRSHIATPQGHGQITVVDRHGRIVNVTVRRRALILGEAPHVIDQALALLDQRPAASR